MLVVEPEQFDRHVKAQRYAAFGVPHYWVLDPDERRLECYTNVDGAFVLSVSGDGNADVSPSVFPGLTVRLVQIWQ